VRIQDPRAAGMTIETLPPHLRTHGCDASFETVRSIPIHFLGTATTA